LLAEHTQKVFHRRLSIRGNDFISGWVYGKMFKNRIHSKISSYRLLRP
jgi:hypothetical protein